MENKIQQILEDLEISSLRYRLIEKRLIRSIKVWNNHYKSNISKPLGSYILIKKIRIRKESLCDTQKALIDLEWNKQIYLNLKK